MSEIYILLFILVGTVVSSQLILNDDRPSNDFLNQQFSGKYMTQQPTNLYGFLDVSSGDIEIIMYNNLQINDTKGGINALFLRMFNPVYHDGKMAVVQFNLTDVKHENNSWFGMTNSQVMLFKKLQGFDSAECNVSYVIGMHSDDGNFAPATTTITMNLEGEGQNTCKFKFTADLKFQDYKLTAILYCLFVSLVILGQILSAYRLIKAYTNGQMEASKLSLTTVAFCNIQDFFLTMMHLYFLMAQEEYYIYFILPIFLLVLLSVVFDMKLLFIVWRAKYMSGLVSTSELRKKLTVFYIKFYLGLFAYLTIMYFFTYEIWSLLIQALLFMPQIVHNVRKGNNPQFYPYYIFGVLGMRMILPLYYRGCPKNIYVIEPSATFCAIWASLFLIQITVLFLQHKLGPRFFVPRCFIPGYYNYNFKYKVEDQAEVLDCPICLQPLTAQQGNLRTTSTVSHPQAINTERSASMIEPLLQVTVMRAPCRHLFHQQCLRNWIDVKLQCPTCRGVLPPLNN